MTSHAADPAADNLFGICARAAADLGCDPLWLRLAFAATLMFNPPLVIGSYLALGVIVLTSRLLFADRPAAPSLPA